ncbi:hypothetical protein BRADI_3g29215v3 [Brachypodium distachyon]|uniref:Cytochrome f n=1 Tax=Brachypodium distachyon TaxID=15368 RepID=A0A0Q3LY23_BRADI|nr:hypothetical protein BRADI_3g29215v3 [Brachypodium distachyon]
MSSITISNETIHGIVRRVKRRSSPGGFGQGDAEIVLQDPLRVQGLLFFFASVILAQVFLVFKKKQFEKVQLYEMNF